MIGFNVIELVITLATRIMATHKNLGFDNSHKDWDSYVERLTQYYVTNDIRDTTTQVCYVQFGQNKMADFSEALE